MQDLPPHVWVHIGTACTSLSRITDILELVCVGECPPCDLRTLEPLFEDLEHAVEGLRGEVNRSVTSQSSSDVMSASSAGPTPQ